MSFDGREVLVLDLQEEDIKVLMTACLSLVAINRLETQGITPEMYWVKNQTIAELAREHFP